MTTCSVDGCGKPVRTMKSGLCNAHYIRSRTNGDPLAGRTFRGAPLKWIKDHVDYAGDDCLAWPFSRLNSGYGNLNVKGQSWLAHRLMTKLAHGDPPSQASESAHSCGRGKDGCCNPRHLRWDSQSGNEADKIGHGTSNRGTRNGRSKLREADVLRIVARRQSGMKYADIASSEALPIPTIASICNGGNWGWLTGVNDTQPNVEAATGTSAP